MSRDVYVAAFWSELALDPRRDLDEIDADANRAARLHLDRSGNRAPARVFGPSGDQAPQTPGVALRNPPRIVTGRNRPVLRGAE